MHVLAHDRVVTERVEPDAAVVVGVLGAVRAENRRECSPLDPACVQLWRRWCYVATQVMTPKSEANITGCYSEVYLEVKRLPQWNNISGETNLNSRKERKQKESEQISDTSPIRTYGETSSVFDVWC